MFIPAALKSSNINCANPSLPTLEMNVVSAFIRAVAMAWFAPLPPPYDFCASSTCNVSPGLA